MQAISNYRKKIFAFVEKLLSGFLILLMTAMVLVVTWQVVTRFLLTEPSSYTEEMARFLLIWIGILGSAYAFRKGAHLGLDLLVRKLEGATNRRAIIVANLACFAFAASVMVFGGTELVQLTLELKQTSSSLGIKVGYIYTVLPTSGLLICLFALDNIFNPDLARVTNLPPDIK